MELSRNLLIPPVEVLRIIESLDICAVIPARIGSSRLPGKVLYPIENVDGNDISILSWKIRQLKKTFPENRIYVSAGEDELEALAKQEGVQYLARSNFYITGNNLTPRQSICGVIENVPHQTIAWSPCVAPFMLPTELQSSIECYSKDQVACTYDSLVAVNELKEYFWYEDKPLNYELGQKHKISQDLPVVKRITNGLYLASKTTMMEYGYFLGGSPRLFAVSKLSGYDIDELEDYEIVSQLTKLYLKKLKFSQDR